MVVTIEDCLFHEVAVLFKKARPDTCSIGNAMMITPLVESLYCGTELMNVSKGAYLWGCDVLGTDICLSPHPFW
jgi:hypothetical protein